MDSLLKLFCEHPEFLVDEKLLRNALFDYYKTNVQMLNIMMNAYKSMDVLDQLKKSHPNLSNEITKWSKRLQYEYSMSPESADKAVKLWTKVFTPEIKRLVTGVEKKKIEEERHLAEMKKHVEQLIEDEKDDEAIEALQAIVQKSDNKSEYAEILSRLALSKRPSAEQRQQLIEEYGDGNYSSYAEGIDRISHLLDVFPGFQQAHIWLKNNPRNFGVESPRIYCVDNKRSYSIIWKDDDPYVKYTVCRAEGRHPRDPNDGFQVCNMISNKKITDELPENCPGVVWKYTIFAIRILDSQWVGTNCVEEAIWVPDPSDIQVSLQMDGKNQYYIRISWSIDSNSCGGVQIIRHDKDYNYKYLNNKLDPDSELPEQKKAQVSGVFDDYDVCPGIQYRYTIKQVKKIGTRTYKSNGNQFEIAVP